MVVNTGRAASRAFYLTMKAQPDLLVPSRHVLDRAVSEFIMHDRTTTLESLSQVATAYRKAVGAAARVGLVFHGVRPRLAYPFTEATNRRLLEHIRDDIGIETAVLVVRDPSEVMESELNRRMADLVGDWRFAVSNSGWQGQFTPAQLRRLNADFDDDPSFVAPLAGVDHAEIVREFSERTGKVASLVELFDSVFDDVVIVPYREFVDDPGATLDLLDEHVGGVFRDRTLVGVKLNGLANRLLVYNHFAVRLLGHPIHFRFEVRDALHLCHDWDELVPLDIDCNHHLPAVADAVQSSIALGVRAADMQLVGPTVADIVRAAPFQQYLLESIAPTYQALFTATARVYREAVYRSSWPDELHTIFEGANGDEIDQTRQILQQAASTP